MRTFYQKLKFLAEFQGAVLRSKSVCALPLFRKLVFSGGGSGTGSAASTLGAARLGEQSWAVGGGWGECLCLSKRFLTVLCQNMNVCMRATCKLDEDLSSISSTRDLK